MTLLGGKCVYLIDDDKGVRDSTAFLLSTLGYGCVTFAAPAAFLDACDTLAPGCVLTDLRMPGMDGFELAAALRDRGVTWPMLMMTSENGDDVGRHASNAGFLAVLRKPMDPDGLENAIAGAFEALGS
jgi:two-component system response regulator FixJ